MTNYIAYNGVDLIVLYERPESILTAQNMWALTQSLTRTREQTYTTHSLNALVFDALKNKHSRNLYIWFINCVPHIMHVRFTMKSLAVCSGVFVICVHAWRIFARHTHTNHRFMWIDINKFKVYRSRYGDAIKDNCRSISWFKDIHHFDIFKYTWFDWTFPVIIIILMYRVQRLEIVPTLASVNHFTRKRWGALFEAIWKQVQCVLALTSASTIAHIRAFKPVKPEIILFISMLANLCLHRVKRLVLTKPFLLHTRGDRWIRTHLLISDLLRALQIWNYVRWP